MILPHDLAPIDVQWNPPARRQRLPRHLRGRRPATGCAATCRQPSWIAAGHRLAVAARSRGRPARSRSPSTAAPPIRAATCRHGRRLAAAAAPGLARRRDRRAVLLRHHRRSDHRRRHARAPRARRAGARQVPQQVERRRALRRLPHAHARRLAPRVQLPRSRRHRRAALARRRRRHQPHRAAGRGLDAGGRQSIFNPDGTRLLTSYQGKLTLRDGMTGASHRRRSHRRAPRCTPTGRPTASTLVFVRPSALCTPGVLPFGQDSIFVYGGSLVTMDVRERRRSPTSRSCSRRRAARTTTTRPIPPTAASSRSRAPTATTKSSWVGGQHRRAPARTAAGSPTTTRRRRCGWSRPRAARRTRSPRRTARPCSPTRGPSGAPRPTANICGSRSRRRAPYGNVLAGANAHHQIWITAIAPAGEQAGDPSSPAVWFPFQDTVTKNHIGMWSVKVGDYSIM